VHSVLWSITLAAHGFGGPSRPCEGLGARRHNAKHGPAYDSHYLELTVPSLALAIADEVIE
jgi:hypothetical protein